MHPGRPVPAGLRLPPAPERERPSEARARTPDGPHSGSAAKRRPTREAPAQSGGNDVAA